MAGNEATLDFMLSEHQSTQSALNEMEVIRGDYHGGNTNTTGGLWVMRKKVNCNQNLTYLNIFEDTKTSSTPTDSVEPDETLGPVESSAISNRQCLFNNHFTAERESVFA